jgi:hypothetical protein
LYCCCCCCCCCCCTAAAVSTHHCGPRNASSSRSQSVLCPTKPCLSFLLLLLLLRSQHTPLWTSHHLAPALN